MEEDTENKITLLTRGEYCDNKLYFKYTTPLDILKAFKKGKLNAIGIDDISLNMIKLALPQIMPIIEHIFNYLLTCGEFPELWKFAIISPIPKINNPISLQHYRPISILPAISKALERIVSDQITEYLEEHKLFDPFQSAYRKDSSTDVYKQIDEVS